MKKIEAFQCEYCEVKYDSEKAALECEKKHPEVLRVNTKGCFSRNYGYLPAYIDVVFSTGSSVKEKVMRYRIDNSMEDDD